MGQGRANQIPHIAYVFDAGFRYCSLISAYSILRFTQGPIRISFFTAQEMPGLDRAATALGRVFAQARIALRVEPALALDFETKHSLPPSSYGRLLLPDFVTGRVLYMDGDTYARRDISPLFYADLQGKPFGAMPDAPIQRDFCYTTLPIGAKVKNYLKPYIENPDLVDLRRYFNSGVMVLDFDRARELGVLDDIFDLDTAVAFMQRHQLPHLDQSWLNHMAADQVTLLDPIWNSIWGNHRTSRLPLNRARRRFFRESRRDPAIVHLAAPTKPWLDHGKPLNRARRRWDREYRVLMDQADRALGLDLRDLLL